MHSVAFNMTASPTSNDHQVRIAVDGIDLISEFSDHSLGIDPPVFFRQEALTSSGKLNIARCECGVPLCDDTDVNTVHEADTVTWNGLPETRFGKSLVFDRAQFLQAVHKASNDHAWETTERTAERCIADLNMALPASHGLRFCWASGRIRDTHIMPSSSVRQVLRERGTAQFKFPNAYEPNLYIQYVPESVMARSDFAMLRTAEQLSKAGLKEAGRKMLVPLCEHLIGYAKHAYDLEKNVFRPIINDGTDLTGYWLPNGGYYGPEGTVMEPIPAGVEFLPSYALAFRLQKDPAPWLTLRALCKGNGLGDIGEKPGAPPQLNHSYTGPFPHVAFAMVEVYKATREHAYLRFAEHVCKNILQQRYHPDNGLFTLDDNHLGCHLDCYEPLALLTVVAAKQDKLDLIPAWDAGGNYSWNHNTILSGYSKFAAKPSVRGFVLRRTRANYR